MNLTAIGTTLPSTWRRVSWQYVSLVSGLAVAGALLVANQRVPAPSEAERSGERPVAATSIPKFSASDPVSLIYIVASEQQAAHLTDLIAPELAASGTNYEVIVAKSDEEAQAMQDSLWQVRASNSNRALVQVEDARPYVTARPASVTSGPKPVSLEQLITVGTAADEAALFDLADSLR